MFRNLNLTVNGPPDVASRFPEDLREFVQRDASNRRRTRIVLEFSGEDLRRTPEARAWLAAEPTAVLREMFYPTADTASSERETLRHLWAGGSGDGSVDGGIVKTAQCAECENQTSWLVPGVSAKIEAPTTHRGLFIADGSNGTVMSDAVAAGLREAGLDSGLGLERLDGDPGFSVIHATESIGMPVCAEGTRLTCDTCGFHRPQWAFYFVFDCDELPAHWVFSEADGDARPMVSPAVADWLRGPGRGLLNEGHIGDSGPEGPLQLFRRGLYPKDADIAFLPEYARP